MGMMMEAFELFPNCIFGVSGMVMLAYPVEGAVEVCRACPLDRLVLETDAPYLSTGSHEIPKLAKQVAKLKELSPVDVMVRASENVQRFFGVNRSSDLRANT